MTRVLESLGSEDHDLLRVPLTATAALLIALNRQVVPRHRAALFAQTVHLMFDAWRARRGAPRVSFDSVRPMLCELAREALLGPISLQRFERACMANGIEVADTIHDEVERHLGVLVREGDTVSFALRSVAESLYAHELRGKSSEVVLAAAREHAGMEPVRHAIGLDAAEGAVQLANERIASLLRRAEEATVNTSTLRQVVTAVRSAADIEQAQSNALNSSTVDAVVGAVADGLLDETSVWVGDLMIEPARRIARAGGAAWTGLRDALRPTFELPADPVHWFIERELSLGDVVQTLWHRDASVRAAAIDAMARHSAEEDVRELLAVMIGDDGHDHFGAPPAVCAGLALRSLPRGPEAEPTLKRLASIARMTGQLMPGAAALALHPGECDARVLVKALKWLSDAYKPGPEVVEEIASTDEGRDALAADWPDWRAHVGDSRQHGRYQPLAPDAIRPPSGEVRTRVVRAIGPKLPEMPPEELGRFTSRVRAAYVAELVSAGRIDKLLTVNLGDAVLGTWGEFGELVAESEVLATHLLNAWETWDRRRPFPGAALERLIGRGSDAAAAVYASGYRCRSMRLV
ncbi:MAG: hypothetical protein IPL61_28400 [Myxococcales bacterium]|nr:hypothetical protein [Myxococcales bacterium]